jgi:hypothetical protein
MPKKAERALSLWAVEKLNQGGNPKAPAAMQMIDGTFLSQARSKKGAD